MPSLAEMKEKEKEANEAVEKIAKAKEVEIETPGETPPATEPPPAESTSVDEISTPAPEPEPEGTLEQKYEKLLQSHKTLQGMFKAEVGKEVQKQLAALQSKLDAANLTIDNLNQLLVSQGPAPATAAPQGGVQDGGDGRDLDLPDVGSDGQFKKLKTEDFEGYGPEMEPLVNMVNSMIDMNKAQQAKINQLESNVGRVNSVTQGVVQNEAQKLMSALTEKVPDWQTINKDPRWLSVYLQEQYEENGRIPPGYKGVTRQQVLEMARDEKNIDEIARIFNAFKKAHGIETEAPPATQTPATETAPAAPAASPLAGQVVPDQTAGAETPTGDQGFKKITHEQYRKFSEQRRKGMISEEQFNKITADYRRTVQEGKAG